MFWHRMKAARLEARLLGRHREKKGGGSKSTSTRTIPNQTAEEKSLQDALMSYAKKGLSMTNDAGGVLDQARAAVGKMYTPDWTQVNGNTTKELRDALSAYDGASREYEDALKGNYDRFASRADAVLGDYNGEMKDVRGQYADLTNGVLPSKFQEARQQALNSDLSKTVGALVNGYASRGVLNSSVTNKALADVSQGAADALARSYTSDLSTEARLLNGRSWMLGDVLN